MRDDDCVMLVVMLIAVILTIFSGDLLRVKSKAELLLVVKSIQYLG